MRSRTIKKTFAVLVHGPWTCLHHMVKLGSQNEITDFFDDFRPGHVPLIKIVCIYQSNF